MTNKSVKRCRWAEHDDLLRHYHDTEWGVPEFDGRALWEKLILDGFQAGLSWRTILQKRPAFRRAFANFDPRLVAQFGDADVARLLQDAGIVRSRAKIVGAINNAQAYLSMQARGEKFSPFCWQAVGGTQLVLTACAPTTQTPLSAALALSLRARGFAFVGPTIVYAWMQATGLVSDHEPGCHLAVSPASTR